MSTLRQLDEQSTLDGSQRILVVEDLPDTRTSLQEVLQLSLKIEVDTAEDGDQGLKMLLDALTAW